MAVMMGELYRALVEGGTSTETARKAAEEIAGYRKQRADIRADLTLLKGLMGITVAGIMGLVIRAFFD